MQPVVTGFAMMRGRMDESIAHLDFETPVATCGLCSRPATLHLETGCGRMVDLMCKKCCFRFVVACDMALGDAWACPFCDSPVPEDHIVPRPL
jgi:hypothetical protein